jgi:hypothetical protein
LWSRPRDLLGIRAHDGRDVVGGLHAERHVNQIARYQIESQLLSGAGEPALRQGVPECAKAVVARGRERALPAERQR